MSACPALSIPQPLPVLGINKTSKEKGIPFKIMLQA
jgi:hypothetical protein